jgi:RNA polymerase sigma-70 factor, ECF subfamily
MTDTPDTADKARTEALAAAEFDLVVAAHERRLGQFLVQMVGNRELAEDLLQETFLVAFRDRARLREVDDVTAWLFAIARNRALHALRTQRRREAGLRQLIALFRDVPANDPSELIGLRELLERHLAPDERALLILRYLHGFDASELGQIVDASPEAVRQRLSRLRRRLLQLTGDVAHAEPAPMAARPLDRSGPDRAQYRATDALTASDERRIARLLVPLAHVTPVRRRRPSPTLSWKGFRRARRGRS